MTSSRRDGLPEAAMKTPSGIDGALALADLCARLDRAMIRAAEAAVVAALIIIFVLVVLLVVLRYVFGTTIVGGNEFIVVLFIYTTAIGAAVAVSRKEHIAINFLVDQLAGGPRKTLDTVGFSLIALINAVMVWYSLTIWIPLTGHFILPALQLPQGYAQAAVPIGCGLVALSSLSQIALLLAGREEAGSPGTGED
ncbi:MAG: TRAP transporter small permease [Proteobacteria bacterium]|nr:TRAP transporter small permease [Pseudomonadota bacterium]